MNSRSKPPTWLAVALAIAAISVGKTLAQSPYWQADTSFAPALERAGSPAVPQAIVRQPDGKLIIAGRCDRLNGETIASGFALARLLSSGATDHTFSAEIPVSQYISRLYLQPDGRIVAKGLFGASTFSASFARFTAGGASDAFFLNAAASGTISGINRIAVGGDGLIYGQIGGTRIEHPALQRYTADGEPDTTFHDNIQASGNLFAPLPDGTVIATETSDSMYWPGIPGQLDRVLPDGTTDPAFDFDPAQLPGNVFALVALPDSRVLAIETISTDAGETFDFIRVDAGGNVDYRYRARVGLPLTLDSVAVLAGVMFDVLHDIDAAATTSLQLDFDTYESETNSYSRASISVGADGICYAATPAGFFRLIRVDGTGPSVEGAPWIPSTPAATTITRNLGDTFTLSVIPGGLAPFVFQWMKDDAPIDGATSATLELSSLTSADAGAYSLRVVNPYGTTTTEPVALTINTVAAAPVLTRQPSSQTAYSGVSSVSFAAEASGNPVPTCDWTFNGDPLESAASNSIADGTITSTFSIDDPFQPAKAGLYIAVAANSAGQVGSSPAILGLLFNFNDSTKVVGDGAEVGTDLIHPNGNIYDQVLLQGAAATIQADPGQVTRTSFIDLNGDIVQVEFSGAGTLSLVLSGASAPALPGNYHQPGVYYVRGHAAIVIAGANETTNVSVFTVGRATAFDPTGAFDITKPISEANNPANNGSPLFDGHDHTAYDGIADLSYIAVLSGDGQFGGLRAGNATFFNDAGYTGVYAPGVHFVGPVYVGNIDAHETATPVLVVGSVSDARITGGDLAQTNSRPVKVAGLTQLTFTAGTNSAGTTLPARHNHARLEQDGNDLTDQIVVNPTP
ncbi:MAG TPA: hypothetical protein VHE13_15600 [Opitutus sp.]|nr:hypothetical protein [Opitutus sp.]